MSIRSSDATAIANASPWPLAVGAVWYTSGGYRSDVRSFVETMFDEFVREHPTEIHWALRLGSNRFVRLTSGDDVARGLQTLSASAGWRLGVRGGDLAAAAALPLLDASGMHDWGARLGRAAHVDLAIAPTDANVQAFPALFKRIAIGLDATSGHASLALVLPPDQDLRKHAGAVYRLMQTYPGLDLYMGERHVAFVETKAIRSIGWLTWVGHDLAARFSTDLLAHPPPLLSVDRDARGILVRAGDAPMLGEKGRPPAAYTAAGRWLSPLRSRRSAPLSSGDDGAFSAAETDAWLARFD